MAINNPLVSIQIPTYNSERTLRGTLEAIKKQNYSNIEVIIVDGYSKDQTLKIAGEYNCRVIMCRGGLMEARIVGIKKSKGRYVLFIDSDQIIHQASIEKAIEKIKDYYYLWLYERAYNKEKILPSLYDADRLLTQKYLGEGVVLPRFFRKDVLSKAVSRIPKGIYEVCRAHEHLVIFHEIKKISKKMGVIGTKEEPAVEHIEPSNFLILFKKQYRWGKTTREFYEKGFYQNLISKKNRFRRFYKEDIVWSIKSFILRVFRGIPYKLGYWFG